MLAGVTRGALSYVFLFACSRKNENCKAKVAYMERQYALFYHCWEVILIEYLASVNIVWSVLMR